MVIIDEPPPPHPQKKDCSIRLPVIRPGEPERFRLGRGRHVDQDRAAATQEPLSPTKPFVCQYCPQCLMTNQADLLRNKHFWFPTRYISALGRTVGPSHPHVFRLVLHPTATVRLISLCIKRLPLFARSYVKNLFPEWFLPGHIILKTQKAGVEDEILQELSYTELKAYDRLKAVQGILVPICYGRVLYRGTTALLLEELGGVSLASPEGGTLGLRELSELLQICHRAMHVFGVLQSDLQMGNFQLVDGKLLVMDFERVEFDLSLDRHTHFMASQIEQLVENYRNMQLRYKSDGLLEAD